MWQFALRTSFSSLLNFVLELMDLTSPAKQPSIPDVSLSDATVKNLLDVLQKLSVAITVVSAALLSNFFLSQESILVKAESELSKLNAIARQVADLTPQVLIEQSGATTLRTSKWDAILPIQLLELKSTRSNRLAVRIKSIRPDMPNETAEATAVLRSQKIFCVMTKSDSNDKTFGSAQTLEDLRSMWDATSVAERYAFKKLESVELRVANHSELLEFNTFELPPRKISKPIDFWYPGLLPDESLYSHTYRTGPGFQTLAILDFKLPSVDAYPTARSLGLPKPPRIWGYIYPVEANSLRNATLRTYWTLVPVNSSLFTKFDPTEIEARPFARAFPNLYELSDVYQKQRLASLQPSLQAAADASREQIEIFGAKFSNKLIPLIGLPLLLILQIQFLAVVRYLRSNVHKLTTEAASEWSFLLPVQVFMWLGLMTLLGLPFIVTGLTVFSQFATDPWLGALGILFGFAILFVGAFAFLEFADVRGSVDKYALLTETLAEEKCGWTDAIRRRLGILKRILRNGRGR